MITFKLCPLCRNRVTQHMPKYVSNDGKKWAHKVCIDDDPDKLPDTFICELDCGAIMKQIHYSLWRLQFDAEQAEAHGVKP